MPRPRRPHLHRERTRHGKLIWVIRIGKGPRIRIRAEFGTPEFDAECDAAVAGAPRPTGGASRAGTLEWLIRQYRDSSAWRAYSPATRRQRENIFKGVIATAGSEPIAKITTATIGAGRDRRKETPFQARHFLDAMGGLFEWAMEQSHVKVDPTANVKRPSVKAGPGFPIWTEEEVVAFEQRWPLGTRQRVWLATTMYSGLRRGDAVRLGRQHVRNGEATIQTEKSGFTVTVTIPILPLFAETLAAGPVGDLAFIVGANGRPLIKESFGNLFHDACLAAGVRKSAHGLRKVAATRLADAGATIHELNAIFGWVGTKMASLYTQEADRKRLARSGMSKLLDKPATSIPAPDDKVRASSKKGQ